MASTKAPTPLRILMLHGYTQTGPLFHAKTRALEKSLQKAFPAPQYALQLHYPTAPIRLHASNIPQPSVPSSNNNNNNSTTTTEDTEEEPPEAYGWWIRTPLNTNPSSSSTPSTATYIYSGLDTTLTALATILRTAGPFDGAIGFSQGAALAGMLASLLEPGRRKAFAAARRERGGMEFPAAFLNSRGSGKRAEQDGEPEDEEDEEELVQGPLRFAVAYSGFGVAENALYGAFAAPQIATPMLHFIGSVDTVVDEARSLALVQACAAGRGARGERLVYHPGGHFLPASQKQFVAVLVGFIKEVMEAKEGERDGGLADGEQAQDLDVPF